MPDIRYVCLSDLHLGEKTSLLTHQRPGSDEIDPLQPSPVMEGLVNCLTELFNNDKNGENKTQPTLILNGDVLELALQTTNQGLMVFREFINLLATPKRKLFKKIIYIPGNHDHHIWELTRETQYVNYLERRKWDETLLPPWHVTPLFDTREIPEPVQFNNMWKKEFRKYYPVPSFIINRLLKTYDKVNLLDEDYYVHIAYPNYGLIDNSGNKCVIFHHGHYIESMYHAMSYFKSLFSDAHRMPDNIWEMEGENFAWVDFFWSTMGRSGEAGEVIDTLYESLSREAELNRILAGFRGRLVSSVYAEHKLFWAMIAYIVLKGGSRYLVDKITKTEKSIARESLSKGTRSGLKKYINEPLKNQIMRECINDPEDKSFVFGHTHKPFNEKSLFSEFKYPEIKYFNSGGWVIGGDEPNPVVGGAITLIDENLDVANVQMYKEADFSIRVLNRSKCDDNPFSKRIRKLLHNLMKNPDSPWSKFSSIMQTEYNHRRDYLKRKFGVKEDSRADNEKLECDNDLAEK